MIQPLTPAHQPALAHFFEANNEPGTLAFFNPFWLDAESARRLTAPGNRDLYFGFFEDDAIVGFGMLRGWEEGFAVPSFGVLVDRAARGCGLGSALTEYAIAAARERGAERLRLTVQPDNTRAVKLYERLGFERQETLPDGRFVMLKELSAP